MSKSAKRFVFLIGTMFSVVILSFANYMRFLGHRDLAIRTSTSLDSCQKLKREIESKCDINSIPFVKMKGDHSIRVEMETMARKASIETVTVTLDSNKSVGNSGYSIQLIRIHIPDPVSLYSLLSFVADATNVKNGRVNASHQSYLLSSLVVESPDKSFFQYGQPELWICSDLTLSCIMKSNKSSR